MNIIKVKNIKNVNNCIESSIKEIWILLVIVYKEQDYASLMMNYLISYFKVNIE